MFDDSSVRSSTRVPAVGGFGWRCRPLVPPDNPARSRDPSIASVTSSVRRPSASLKVPPRSKDRSNSTNRIFKDDDSVNVARNRRQGSGLRRPSPWRRSPGWTVRDVNRETSLARAVEKVQRGGGDHRVHAEVHRPVLFCTPSENGSTTGTMRHWIGIHRPVRRVLNPRQGASRGIRWGQSGEGSVLPLGSGIQI